MNVFFPPTLLKILTFDFTLHCKHITAYQRHRLHLLCWYSEIYQNAFVECGAHLYCFGF